MPSPTPRTSLAAEVTASLIDAFETARPDREPYSHWFLSNVFPVGVPESLRELPFPTPDLGGVSGKRELHNDQRNYFDAETNARFELCAAIADSFQSRAVVDAIERVTGANLAHSYVRLEYAQDTDGFWLEPHTDLGVKLFTMLIYLPDGPVQHNLGTDIYADAATWAKRPPFSDNCALVFVPGANTWHGLAKRPIEGVRRSVIMNYVSDDWRARDQLAYPETPVRD